MINPDRARTASDLLAITAGVAMVVAVLDALTFFGPALTVSSHKILLFSRPEHGRSSLLVLQVVCAIAIAFCATIASVQTHHLRLWGSLAWMSLCPAAVFALVFVQGQTIGYFSSRAMAASNPSGYSFWHGAMIDNYVLILMALVIALPLAGAAGLLLLQLWRLNSQLEPQPQPAPAAALATNEDLVAQDMPEPDHQGLALQRL